MQRLLGQRLFGNLGLSRIEAWVELQRPPQILLSGRTVPRGSRDHSGVVKQLRVLRAQSQSVLDRLPRLVNLSGFERSPGQSVRAVDVAPRFIFSFGELISFARFQIVVCVKERDLAVVKLAARSPDFGRLFAQRVLRFGLFRSPGDLEQVSESRDGE